MNASGAQRRLRRRTDTTSTQSSTLLTDPPDVYLTHKHRSQMQRGKSVPDDSIGEAGKVVPVTAMSPFYAAATASIHDEVEKVVAAQTLDTEPDRQASITDVGSAAEFVPNDVHAAMLNILSVIPMEAWNPAIPKLILQHQIYTIVQNRTVADQQLEELRMRGVVRIFRLGISSVGMREDVAVMLTTDYVSHVRKSMEIIDDNLAERFLEVVVGIDSDCSSASGDRGISLKGNTNHHHSRNTDCGKDHEKSNSAVEQSAVQLLELCGTSVLKSQLVASGRLTSSDVQSLISRSCVTLRDASSLWFAVPNAGGKEDTIDAWKIHCFVICEK